MTDSIDKRLNNVTPIRRHEDKRRADLAKYRAQLRERLQILRDGRRIASTPQQETST